MSKLDDFIAGVARFGEAKAEKALEERLNEVKKNLTESTDYGILHDTMDTLASFPQTFPERTIEVLDEFLKRLSHLKLTYGKEHAGYPRLYDAARLKCKALDILIQIRYFSIERTFQILCDQTLDSEDIVRKKAFEGIKSLAEFNLDILEAHGVFAQKALLDVVEKLETQKFHQYFGAIIAVCQQLLQHSMTGTAWTYKTMTWKSASLPDKPVIREVRDRTASLLFKIYDQEHSDSRRNRIIDTLHNATLLPSKGGVEFERLAEDSKITILKFYLAAIQNSSQRVRRTIEKDTFWIFVRSTSPEVEQLAFAIHDALQNDAEYLVFKSLVGYDGEFYKWIRRKDWPNGVYDFDRQIDEEQRIRTGIVEGYAKSVNEENFSTWRKRILALGETNYETDSLVYLGKFLEHFATVRPELAFELLPDAERLNSILLYLLVGLFNSKQKDKIKLLVNMWAREGKHLLSISRVVELCPDTNPSILAILTRRAVENNDWLTLTQLVSTIFTRYDRGPKGVLRVLFLYIVTTLAGMKKGRWVRTLWFRLKASNLLEDLSSEQIKKLLDSLVFIERIDYDEEELLEFLATKVPEDIFDFFFKRVAYEEHLREASKESDFDAIPFAFHKLSEPLSKNVDLAFDTVASWARGNARRYVHEGASLLKNIFPDFPPEFSDKLKKLLPTATEPDLTLVLAILACFHGSEKIYSLVRELLKAHWQNDKVQSHVMMALDSTGVVSGEFGLMRAYEEKKAMISQWLQDPDEHIVAFAKHYIRHLDHMIESARKSAEADIALMKYEYGEAPSDDTAS